VNKQTQSQAQAQAQKRTQDSNTKTQEHTEPDIHKSTYKAKDTLTRNIRQKKALNHKNQSKEFDNE